MPVPAFDSIDGLPPAVALHQQRGVASTRSTVGSVTTLSNLVRMLFSRAGDYPDGLALLEAEAFSRNTPVGACPKCHGLGRLYEVTERSLIPNPSLSIRERAIAAWPTAWQGQNLRDIVTTLGFDIDRPWRELSKKDRDWLLFTDEQPVVPVYDGLDRDAVKRAIAAEIPASYRGTFISARRHVLRSFTNTQSAGMRKRALQFMVSAECPLCMGKGLGRDPLAVTFAGCDIAEFGGLPLGRLHELLSRYATSARMAGAADHPEKTIVAQRITADLVDRLAVLLDLGLGYLSMDRTTPSLSPGEHQRLRLATQVRSNLFGVAYVLDEPSAGLHPADTRALLAALRRLKMGGNSLFIVEHNIDLIREADWVVDVGPGAGELGGSILYSGPPDGLQGIAGSRTREYLFPAAAQQPRSRPRTPRSWLSLAGVTWNNLLGLDVAFPVGVFTTVTGVSGSGKSSLAAQVLVKLVSERLGLALESEDDGDDAPEPTTHSVMGGRIVGGMEHIRRLVRIDQNPIGRTPRSNLATYTGLFDHVRHLFAETELARARRYDPGRFSFNVAKGRCATCAGDGSVMVELLFLPSVYTTCPSCQGARYNPQTLEVVYRGKSIADVLGMTVDVVSEFLADERPVGRILAVLRDVGLGYLRLGQPATELSGGEAQRIKLAKELQRGQQGATLYVLDEPTTGLHPADVARLMVQLEWLVDSGNTVVVVEHDMNVAGKSDWVIDVGPGAGGEGGRIVVAGTPEQVAKATDSRTAPFLARALAKERIF